MNPPPLTIPARIEIDYDVDTASVPSGGKMHASISMRGGRVVLESGATVFEFDREGINRVMAAREDPCNAQSTRPD